MNRTYTQLTDIERYQIEAYLKVGKSQQFIANQLGVNKSTISREIKRNSTKTRKYSARLANQYANERKERYGRARKFTKAKQKIIDKYLTKEQWSPKQILGHCKRHDIEMVSHERIYQYIREDKSKGGSLYKELRHKLKHRKRPIGRHFPVKDRVPISERPDIINSKQRFGDWEIDTIIGKDNKGAIVTIVERTTAFFMMRKLSLGKDAKNLSQQVIEILLPYKNNVLSITSDNGSEFADHKNISKKLDTEFYFANPYASWERGLSEYTNKLIRQYIPKKANFEEFTDQQIKQIQYKINRRPRENLNFETPKDQFCKFPCAKSTGRLFQCFALIIY